MTRPSTTREIQSLLNMPTKLKKPITITLTHVENAVSVAMCHCGVFNYDTPCEKIHPNIRAVRERVALDEISSQLLSALQEQGIDWNTWLPEKPFVVADRQCEFNPDGTVKLSCGTVITNEQVEEFVRRREAALEWPKFFCRGKSELYRAESATDFGSHWITGYGWMGSGVPPVAVEYCSGRGWRSISRKEAEEITGKKL